MGREKKKSIFETQTTPTDFLFPPLHTFGPPAYPTASRAAKGQLTLSKALAKEREREGEGRTSTLSRTNFCFSLLPHRCTCIFVNNSTPPLPRAAAAGGGGGAPSPPPAAFIMLRRGREGRASLLLFYWRALQNLASSDFTGWRRHCFFLLQCPTCKHQKHQNERMPNTVGLCFLSMQLSRNERPRAPVAPCPASCWAKRVEKSNLTRARPPSSLLWPRHKPTNNTGERPVGAPPPAPHSWPPKKQAVALKRPGRRPAAFSERKVFIFSDLVSRIPISGGWFCVRKKFSFSPVAF